MYFVVVCVVGVVWSSCCSFCSYTRFILRDNYQNYANPNLREHQKQLLGVSSVLCLFNIYFFMLRVLLLLLLLFV